MTDRLPRPATVVACVALFVALSGGAWASGIVPLAQHARTADVASNAKKLGGKTPAQIKASLRGARGPQGIQGIQGIQGPAGTPGTAAVTVHSQAYSLNASGTAGDQNAITANCGTGQLAVGGGFDSTGSVFNLDTRATNADDGWTIYLINSDNSTNTGTVLAYCLG